MQQRKQQCSHLIGQHPYLASCYMYGVCWASVMPRHCMERHCPEYRLLPYIHRCAQGFANKVQKVKDRTKMLRIWAAWRAYALNRQRLRRKAAQADAWYQHHFLTHCVFEAWHRRARGNYRALALRRHEQNLAAALAEQAAVQARELQALRCVLQTAAALPGGLSADALHSARQSVWRIDAVLLCCGCRSLQHMSVLHGHGSLLQSFCSLLMTCRLIVCSGNGLRMLSRALLQRRRHVMHWRRTCGALS